LKDATIQITSLGEPKFVAGKTPAVKPHPYIRLTEASGSGSTVTFGLDNPTRVSSEAPGHSGRLANDGNPGTFWQTSANDPNAWLCVYFELRLVQRKLSKDNSV